MNMDKKKTKVDLVTGFLGAGKTTFIKNMPVIFWIRAVKLVCWRMISVQ